MGERSPAGKLSKRTTDIRFGESGALNGRTGTKCIAGGVDEAANGRVQSVVRGTRGPSKPSPRLTKDCCWMNRLASSAACANGDVLNFFAE